MKRRGTVGIVVQARMGSRRLPGKVLEPIGELPLLAFLLRRVSQSRYADRVVVATSRMPTDDLIAERCSEWKTEVFRDSEMDVLGRYIACARAYEFELVVRVTADNPLTDPDGLDAVIEALDSSREVYAHTRHVLGFPYGTGAEAIRASTLFELGELTTDALDREHVTSYLLRHPTRFPVATVNAPATLRAPGVFLTVDYPEDLEFFRRLHSVVPLSPETPLGVYLEALSAHPEIAQLNRHRHVGFELADEAAKWKTA